MTAVRLILQSGETSWDYTLEQGGQAVVLPPALQPAGPYLTEVRAVPPGADADAWHPAVEEIAHAAASISWTGTHRDFTGAADDAIERSRYQTSTPDRAELVRAAGFLVAAIAAIDAQAPVEVRRDDLRAALAALEFATPFVEVQGPDIEDAALRRLRDALEGR